MIFFQSDFDYEALSQRIFSILHKFSNPQDIYPQLLKIAMETADTDGGSLVIKDGERYTVKECLGWESFAFRIEECLPFIYWLRRHQAVVTRQQLLSDPYFAPIKKAGLAFFVQFQTEICLPLFVQEGLYGFINLGPKRDRKRYPGNVPKRMSWLSTQFSLVLQNVELKGLLGRQQMELRACEELKSQMLANLSHELRTPLTSVLGFAEILEAGVDGPMNVIQKGHVRSILESGSKLHKILSTLMDLARLETGATLVTSMLSEIALPEKTRLEMNLNGQTPRIYGDLPLVRQVFKHLLDNAAKYTSEGTITVSAAKKGEMVEVCVADTGIGIAAEKLEMIFEGFCQADGGITRTFQGAGLGLAVTKKLVQLHGGRLWVLSRPGQGSRFYFTLPLKPISIRHKELAA